MGSDRRFTAPPPSLDELTEHCQCGHQNGAHTAGAKAFGWAIYDKVWSHATGACGADGCDCPRRTARPVRIAS